MAITVRTNAAAGRALTDLNKTSRSLSRSFERISSGLRISRAADDAAGLGVAENLRAQHTSATVAARNTNDGISAITVAEGATNEVSNLLVRMRELAVQSSSETLGATERGYAQSEFTSLKSEVDRIANVTEFNGTKLTDGSTTTLNIQVGTNNSANDQIGVTFSALGTTALGVGASDISSVGGAQTALDDIDAAISTVNSARASYGASENRLNSALNNIETYGQTVQSAESQIRDADFGAETASLSNKQILQQAGVSILGQAKQINQAALSLLQ
jgi:flagellin